MPGHGAGEKLRALIELTKPKQLALLMLTMYGAYLVGGRRVDALEILLLSVLGVASIGGVTALNMYLDLDVDARMKRTRRRPLPSRIVSRGEALAFSVTMISLGLLAASALNPYVVVAILLGLFFDIIAYTELTKRFTPLNIIAGSVAGAMPALGGWAAGYGSFSVGGLMLAGIVYAWQPMHVWFLAYYFEDDYRSARIPLAPFDYDPRRFSGLVAFHLALIGLLVWGFVFLEGVGLSTALLSTALAAMAIARVASFSREPSRENALRIFKLATPIIALVFLLLPIDVALQAFLEGAG